MTLRQVHVVGAGLAGCEAAWQLACRDVPVTLTEMKPVQMSGHIFPPSRAGLRIPCGRGGGNAGSDCLREMRGRVAILDHERRQSARPAAAPCGSDASSSRAWVRKGLTRIL